MTTSKELLEALGKKVSSPNEIDIATEDLAVAPRLINYHLAVAIDLSSLGLGNCLYLPVQVSNNVGGRKSLYRLTRGEKAMAGLIIGGNRILLRYVTRESGASHLPQTGDVYTEEIRALDGTVIASGPGKLKIVNEAKGQGELTVAYKSNLKPKPLSHTWRWYFFSLYAEGGDLS